MKLTEQTAMLMVDARAASYARRYPGLVIDAQKVQIMRRIAVDALMYDFELQKIEPEWRRIAGGVLAAIHTACVIVSRGTGVIVESAIGGAWHLVTRRWKARRIMDRFGISAK